VKHENPETEAAVIGALLAGDATQLIAAGELRAEDFARPFHRACFNAITALAERRRPVSPATVWALVSEAGSPKHGAAELEMSALADRSEAEFLSLAAGLRRHRHERQMREFLLEQLEQLEAGAEPVATAGVMETFARGLMTQEQGFTFGDADVTRLAEEWEQAESGHRKPHLPTGIRALDDVVMGWEENLNVIGGASSAGKSSLIATSVLSALEAGHRLGFFGLEDGTGWLARRFVSMRTGVPLKQVGRVQRSDAVHAKVSDAFGYYAKLLQGLITVKPVGGTRIHADALLAKCRTLIHRHGVRAVFIDHGLEIDYAGERGERADDRRHRIDRTFSQLRTLALETHTPIIVVVHFNREGSLNDGEPPRQEHFAECAGIERMSRLSLGLWSTPHDGDDEIRCTVMKQTEGRRWVHLVLKRHIEAAMLAASDGREVNLRDEKRQREQAARAERKAATNGTKPHAREAQEEMPWEKN
jgi:replicative DNA helicase